MATKDKPKVLCQSAIRSHTWNAAKDSVALVPNNKDIIIYSVTGDDCTQWQPRDALTNHDQKVLAVDWDPTTNRLLSCSEDRTAYVWECTGGKWDPKVVHLGSSINRAVLCCSWSPDGRKFAVGTGANLVCVCYFEEEHNWWVGKAIKHHSSSITALAWHPQHPGLLATCSTDRHVRLFSAFIKGVDAGENLGKFGSLIHDIPAKAWVRDCKWSPDGTLLAFVAHDATLTLVDITDDYKTQTLKTKLLPFNSIVFPNDNVIVAACNDCFLYTFARSGANWVLNGKLKGTEGNSKATTSSVSRAMAKFQLEASTGQAKAVDKLESKHQNVISELRVLQSGTDWKISSSGYDGQIYLWSSKDVEAI